MLSVIKSHDVSEGVSSLVSNIDTREIILVKLQQAFKDKTYVLILNDCWNNDALKWQDFLNGLSGVTGTNGNIIILTTRSMEVASMVNPIHIHHLGGLSDEDCWSIIKEKAFTFRGKEIQPEFERIGANIAKRCHGLPLAAQVVGGVLRDKSEEGWVSVEQNWLTEVEGDDISRILKVSFDNLSPPSLKRCFTFCSIFPKGFKIRKQMLIEFWMAEGFLQANQTNDLESVGEMYVNALVHKSLLQLERNLDYGDVDCGMHDLVHDLASSVLGPCTSADDITRVRYMIHRANHDPPIPKEVAKHLRTLFLGGEYSGFIFSDFECTRHLVLVNSGVEELPHSIRKLKHLRRLDVSETSIEVLPEWIGKLRHLQILKADNEKLKKLPSTLKYLINLMHLYNSSGVELSTGIGTLTSLQILIHFTVGGEGSCQIKELGTLNNLEGRLEISNLENVRDKEEALQANISLKPNLFVMSFEWDESREGKSNDESVLEGLEPHRHLKKLLICGFRGIRFPLWTLKMAVRDESQGSWVALDKLIVITLKNCKECEEIPALDQLPNLKCLSLYGLKKVRFINTSFNRLTLLHIKHLDGLEALPDWLFYNNQTLTELKINACPKLRQLPNGLDTLSSLEELLIWDCPNLKSIGKPSGRAQSLGMLNWLHIGNCQELVDLPREMVELWIPFLRNLILYKLSSLNNLPMLIDCLAKAASSLSTMFVVDVPGFKATSRVDSWALGSLHSLTIGLSDSDIGSASEEIVDGMIRGCSKSLRSLRLQVIESWDRVPTSIQNLTALDSLMFEKFGMEGFPEWFGNMSSLVELSIYNCKKLQHLPSKDGLTKLRKLKMVNCPGLFASIPNEPSFPISPSLLMVQENSSLPLECP